MASSSIIMHQRRIPPVPGVYVIESVIDNRKYVGGTCNLRNRLKEHKFSLRRGVHENPNLRNFYNEYGNNHLKFSPLEFCSEENLSAREQFYLDSLQPSFNVHKSTKGRLGLPLSYETKRKISEANKIAQKGKKGPMDGKQHTEETKRKLSEIAKKRRLSEATKQKISASLKGRPSPTAGRPLSEEHKQKLRDVASKYRHSQESKDKIRKALTGKKKSKEHVEKCKEAMKKFWAAKINHKDSTTSIPTQCSLF